VRILIRTMLTAWAFLAFCAALVLFFSSTLLPLRERTLPMHLLELCAKHSVEQYRLGVAQTLLQLNASCFGGQLISSGIHATSDPSGRSLSSDEIQLVRRAEQDDVVATQYSPKQTIIAFRPDPSPTNSYIYLVTVPLTQGNFFTRNLRVLSPIIIAGFLSVFVAIYVVGPLARLSTAAERFGAGDLKTRITSSLATRKDELGDLARTFNGMAERVESLVTRYKNFLAHASHEIGSPLTRLNIALALARRKGGCDLEQEHERIWQEAHRLNSLVQEMLLLARLESGNELNKEPSVFDVGSVVEEAHQNAVFESQQLQKNTTITAMDRFSIRGYPDLLLRAVDNVLRNGLRFAQNQVSVEVSCLLVGTIRMGLITIRDDGPGIPPGEETSIFEPFVTLPSNQSDAGDGGSGLGLAIARQAVIANGGRISAYRSSEGGLRIEIELPVEG